MAEMKKDREDLYWKEKYKKEYKLRQEAEGELTIVKGISVHMSPEMRDAKKKIEELQSNLERTKKENNELYNRIAELINLGKSHQELNGKLQIRVTELEKKINDKNNIVEQFRKQGIV